MADNEKKAKIDLSTIKIVPLSNENMEQAVALIRGQLDAQTAELDQVAEGPEVCFKHALNKQTPEAQAWGSENGIDMNRLQYFLAVDKSSGEMLGFSGIYSTSAGYLERTAKIIGYTPDPEIVAKFESPETFCMGWSAVTDEMKGKGVGSVLMAHGMKLAAEMSEKEGLQNPKWGILSDEGATSFYEHRGFTNIGKHGVEAIFVDDLARAQEKVAAYAIPAESRITKTSWVDKIKNAASRPGTIGLVGAAANIPQSFGINPDNLLAGKGLELGSINPMLAISGAGLLVGAHIFRSLGKGRDEDGNYSSATLRKLNLNETNVFQLGLASTLIANGALMKFGVDIGHTPQAIVENLSSGNYSGADVANPFVSHSLYAAVSGFSAFLTTPMAKKLIKNFDGVAANHAQVHAAVSTVAGSLVAVMGSRLESTTLTVVGALYAGEALERAGALKKISKGVTQAVKDAAHTMEDIVRGIGGENKHQSALRNGAREITEKYRG